MGLQKGEWTPSALESKQRPRPLQLGDITWTQERIICVYDNLRGILEDGGFIGLTGGEIVDGRDSASGVNPEPCDRRAARRASSKAAACADRVVRWGVWCGCCCASNRSRCRTRRGPLVTLARGSARLVGGVSSILKFSFSNGRSSLCTFLAQSTKCLESLKMASSVCCLRWKLLWWFLAGKHWELPVKCSWHIPLDQL